MVFSVITAAMAKAICNRAASRSKPSVPASASPLRAGHLQRRSHRPRGARAGEGSGGPAARGERRVFGAASAGLIAACSGGDGQRSWERSCRPSVFPPQTLSSCPEISSRCKTRHEPFLRDVTAPAAGLEQELRVERCPETWSNS